MTTAYQPGLTRDPLQLVLAAIVAAAAAPAAAAAAASKQGVMEAAKPGVTSAAMRPWPEDVLGIRIAAPLVCLLLHAADPGKMRAENWTSRQEVLGTPYSVRSLVSAVAPGAMPAGSWAWRKPRTLLDTVHC